MSKTFKIRDVISKIEDFAPPAYQESYDNAGLIVGNSEQEVSGVLITLDTTEEIVDEAIEKGANLIVSHHPIVFSGLKRFNGRNYIERTVIKAIKNDIAIYAAHTNLDSVIGGVNTKIAEKIGLKNVQILSPKKEQLQKLVFTVPIANAEKVRTAIFEAGAGHIGNYDCCSFNVECKGTFRASENTNPYVGEKGKIHTEEEIKIETIFPKYLQNKIVKSLINSHPYEEVAYDIYSLENSLNTVGIGVIGELENPEIEMDFLKKLKQIFEAQGIKYTNLLNKKIKKVAICGGAGSFLLRTAIAQKADIFVSGDFKYHQYFDAEEQIVIADIGHYESEQFTKEIFYDIISQNFATFAVYLSEKNTNPINYL